MTIILQRELQRLKGQLLELSSLAEECVYIAVKSFSNKESELVKQVVEQDHEIDIKEVEIEEDCLKILALHHPVAIDLRVIISILKINNDLERIGDLAVNIAHRSAALSTLREEMRFDFTHIAELTQAMLRQSIESFVELDSSLARKVLIQDDEVDALHRAMFNRVEAEIQAHPADTSECIMQLSISRNFERIADLATNIAEDVIYMIDGDIVRHQRPGTVA